MSTNVIFNVINNKTCSMFDRFVKKHTFRLYELN